MAYIGRTPTNAALTASDLADGIVTTAKIDADAVTDAKIADDVVGTEHLTANEVDTAALGADAVTGAQLADNAVNSEHYTDGSIDTAHLADGQVTVGKLATAVLTGATDIGAAIADADLFLVDDGAGGTLRKTAASRLKTYIGGGITEADNWRLTANTNAGSDAFVTANWERSDSNGYTEIGTGLTESSGVFSFATTGIYLITYHAAFAIHGGDVQAVLALNTTLNNSSYVQVCHAIVGQESTTDGVRGSASSSFIFDVTNTTNCKFKFNTESMSTSTVLVGNTSHSFTTFTMMRLGDT